jgi:hypothetical protein
VRKSSKFLLGAIALIGTSVIEVDWTNGLQTNPRAEARVGRPLTPMSYAGVARRTARRCAAGVYYCQKDKKIPTRVIESKKVFTSAMLKK